MVGTKVLKYPAKNKKHTETVVFIHHMFGNYRTTRRHQIMVNEMGYDCVSFDLVLASDDSLSWFNPLLKKLHLRIFEIWKLQIEEVLNQVKGNKVVFSFSGPSLSSLLAVGGRKDIVKVICDGGPFDDMEDCLKSMFEVEQGMSFQPFNWALSFFMAKIWGEKKALKHIHECLKQWDSKVPILSIRGGEDPIIPSQSIDKIFQAHQELPIDIFVFPQGKHIDGLKSFKEVYIEKINSFLSRS